MRHLVLVLLASLTIPALAGDGGYTLYSCTSGSGRTQLSLLMSHYSGSETPFVIRLTVDGQQAAYASAGNQSPNIDYNYEKGVIRVDGGSSLTLNVQKPESAKPSVTIKAGYTDPRVGTEMQYYGDNSRDIQVNCIRYHQGP